MKTKSVGEKLIARNYVASVADIKELTVLRMRGSTAVLLVNADYLKSLTANTQVELGVEARSRAAPEGRFPKLNAETMAQHLSAMEAVHKLFYAGVLEAIDEESPDLDPKERNAASNYARSSKSMLRAWIAAGNDVRGLAPARVTKASLAVERPPPQRNAAQLQKVMVRQASGLATAAGTLQGLDRQAAVEAIETVMASLAKTLTEMGVEPTRDARKSIDEHRPFRLKEGIFWPANYGAAGAAAAAG